MKQQASTQNIFESDSSLYVGSKSKPYTFIKTSAASTFSFTEGSLKQIKNLLSLRSALSYRFPQTFLNPLYEKLYLPCVPAYDLTLSSSLEKYHNFLKIGPFIKTQVSVKVHEKLQAHQVILEGFQSGIRSGIVIYQQTSYRLKGCGNLDEGFILKRGVTEDSETYEIRGCMFNHTVKRELYITNVISKILESNGFLCGNKSLGFWEYNGFDEVTNKFGNYFGKPLRNECPEVDKYCGVFETLGDKRLGTHLLQGIKLLVHLLLLMNRDDINPVEIKKIITKQERIEQYQWEKEIGSFHLSQTIFCMRDSDTFETINMDMKAQAKNNLIFNWDFENKHNINSLELIQPSTNSTFPFCFSYLQNPDKIAQIESLLSQLNIHPDYNVQFFQHLNQIDETENTFYELLLIYYRIGWELGSVKRIFIDNHLNWGYFRDHHRMLYHCNAHLNNFIVLNYKNRKIENSLILAPLDFDLAHFKDEYICLEYDFDHELKKQQFINQGLKDNVSPDELIKLLPGEKKPELSKSYGKFDEKAWNWAQEMERQYLEIGMSGVEIIMNSIMNEINIEKCFPANLIQSAEMFEILLRDQMRIGYLRGFQLEPFSFIYEWKENFAKCYRLIELALILTSDVTA